MARAILALAVAVTGADGTVAVTGATGKLGRHAVEQLVAAGHPVRCLVRCQVGAVGRRDKEATSEEVAAWLASLPGVELIQGEVTDGETLQKLLQGCSACLALHGSTRFTKVTDWLPWVDEREDSNHGRQVNCEAIAQLLAAAEQQKCPRLVRVTGKGEDPWSITSILINALGSMAKAWNFEGERRLRGANIDYTIVRPGFMGDVDATLDEDKALALADNGGDLKVTAIPHRSVAELCVRSLAYPQAKRATLVAMTVPGPGARTWDPLLEKVRPDRRSFPGPELLDEHYLAVRLFGAVASGLAAAAAAIANGT
ncbi:Uncharacterized protein ycf39 (ORF319) [Durusdinium trenchii]|uniref:Uncharacterized protein ycf39 (ORF319) n=1 Tax=Durusdinium trenchii TaxID=1381693 RepID=A0ABP0SQB5_9DINO